MHSEFLDAVNGELGVLEALHSVHRRIRVVSPEGLASEDFLRVLIDCARRREASGGTGKGDDGDRQLSDRDEASRKTTYDQLD